MNYMYVHRAKELMRIHIAHLLQQRHNSKIVTFLIPEKERKHKEKKSYKKRKCFKRTDFYFSTISCYTKIAFQN